PYTTLFRSSLREEPGRDRGRPRGARCRRHEVFVVPPDRAQLRPRHRLVGGTAALLLHTRHAGGVGVGCALLRRHVGAARARLPDPRGDLGPRHPAVHPDRHGAVRPRPGRRVRRPHPRAGARAAALPRPRRARKPRPLRIVAVATAVVFGYGDLGLRGLAALLEAGLEVPLVVTHRDDPNETRWYGSLFDFSRSR